MNKIFSGSLKSFFFVNLLSFFKNTIEDGVGLIATEDLSAKHVSRTPEY